MKDTSWKKVGPWYSKITAGGGHYYHTHVVLPGVVRLLDLQSDSSLLDLACGTGVLAAHIPPTVSYTGVDLAPNLITEARSRDHSPLHTYQIADVTRPLTLTQTYSHAAIVLALQNMQDPQGAITNAYTHLTPSGRLVIVLNHPAFRIPRQSSWGIDPGNKLQYRRVNRYLSPLEIPITAHPGEKQSAVTWSYHLPLSGYTSLLTNAGFAIIGIEEWTSDKESVGTAKRQENRARSEFPLFLTLVARKLT